MRIADIAKAAKVSTATVSRVINGKKGVSDKERERVQAIIESFNYQPNLLGQTLRRSSTNTLLAIIPTLSNPFYSEILTAMEEEAVKNNYVLLICEQNRFLNLYLDRLKSKLIDGVILFYAFMDAQELNALAKNYPIVQCCEIIPDSNTPTVSIDNYQAGRDVAKLLWEKGHRCFAFVGGDAMSEALRYKGFCDTLLDYGLAEENISRIETERHPSSNILTVQSASFKSLLTGDNAPTAVFCSSDELAMQTVQWLERHHYNVPLDISVIGFDDQNIMKYFRPRLTTVAQDKAELGKSAVNALISKINSIDSDNEKIVVRHWIEQRETVTECPKEQ